MKLSALVIVVLLPFVCGSGTELRGYVDTSSARIELTPFDNHNHNIYKSLALQNKTFNMLIPDRGSYLLNIRSTEHKLLPNRFRVDYLEGDLEPKIWVLNYGDEFSSISDSNRIVTINITSVSPREYIMKRKKPIWETGLIAYLISNPIYLLMGLVAVLFTLFPMLISRLDPELMDKVKQE